MTLTREEIAELERWQPLSKIDVQSYHEFRNLLGRHAAALLESAKVAAAIEELGTVQVGQRHDGSWNCFPGETGERHDGPTLLAALEAARSAKGGA